MLLMNKFYLELFIWKCVTNVPQFADHLRFFDWVIDEQPEQQESWRKNVFSAFIQQNVQVIRTLTVR